MENDFEGLDPNRMTELWILAKRFGYAGSGVTNLKNKLEGMGVPILRVGKSVDYHLVRNRDLWRLFDA